MRRGGRVTRVALTVDTECVLCAGLGLAQTMVEPYPTVVTTLCVCVRPETIPDAGGRDTLGRPGGKQATKYVPSLCRICEGAGNVRVARMDTGEPIDVEGMPSAGMLCPRCHGCGQDPEDIDASAGYDR